MKKHLALILLIIPAFFVKGQATYNDSREEFLASMQHNKKFSAHIAAGKIASMQTFWYKHNKPTGTLMYEARYNNRGNNTDWFIYNNGKVKKHTTTNYDDSNRVIESALHNRTGKLKWMLTYTYDKSGNTIEEDKYKKNPQTIATKTIKTYDSKNNITETKLFGKKGNLKSRIEYTYYDEGSKKQTTEYSGKGKVKRIWNFDCNPVGKLEAKKLKDTSKVCIHYETDKDGNLVKVIEEYEGSTGLFGMFYRSITKYDKDNNMIDAAYYKFNGKQIYHWSATYNVSGRITEYILYEVGTTKPWFRTTYTYNNDGYLAEAVNYKKSKVGITMKYVYTSSVSTPAK